MVSSSCFNNLLVKVIFKSNAIIIKGKSKLRIKKGAKFHSPNNGQLTLGSGDGATSNFRHSGFNLELLENSKLSIFGNVHIGYHGSLRIEKNAEIQIGSNTYLSASCLLRAAKKITIGDNCAISWNVTILDSDFHEYCVDNILQNNTKEVTIGNNVWIGNNVIILKGVTIGDYAIVGAGSVVTKNIDSYTVVAGNPARKIKNNIQPLNTHKL